MKLTIKNSEHVFIAGSTGSGKTILAQSFGAKEKKVIVLDTKGTFYFEPFLLSDDYIIVETLEDLKNRAHKINKIVYRPIFQELNQESFNEFFKFCYYLGNITIIVDEAMQVIKNHMSIPEYYAGILQRGRELNVSIWSLTQRPSGIHQLIMSEATHYFIFRLTLMNDRKKISDITGQEKFLKVPKGFNFRYWRNGSLYTELGVINIKNKLKI
jgi:DNA helicase HerA-like ATPase